MDYPVHVSPVVECWSFEFFSSVPTKASLDTLNWIKLALPERIKILCDYCGVNFSVDDVALNRQAIQKAWLFLFENSEKVPLSEDDIVARNGLVDSFMLLSSKNNWAIDKGKIRSVLFERDFKFSDKSMSISFDLALMLSRYFIEKYNWVDWYLEKRKSRPNFNTPTLWMCGQPGPYIDCVTTVRICLEKALQNPSSVKIVLEDVINNNEQTLNDIAKQRNV